jgi:AcrR family transcriptional regulator
VRSETRNKILDAARQLFIEQGYDAVTMRKVAQAVEYSPTALYVHFNDKEALMRELCTEDFNKLAESFQAVLQVEDPIERLEQVGIAYVNFAVQFPNHYRLMFMTPRPPEVSTPEERKGNIQQDAYALLIAVVQSAMEKNCFRPEWSDPELVAQILWAGVHGVVALHLIGAKDKWVDWRPLPDTVAGMVKALLHGLAQEGNRDG